jgi:hypothetical protein
MQTKFDMFVQPPNGKSCRITATTSFEEAEKRVDQLSRCCAARYLIYSEKDGGIVERIAA